MSKSLRSKLIRLAYEKPHLREHVLPLVRVAAGGTPDWAQGKKFTHPKTRNKVTWGSLPAEEQAKLRKKHDKGGPKGGGGSVTKADIRNKVQGVTKPGETLEKALSSLAEDHGGSGTAKDLGGMLKRLPASFGSLKMSEKGLSTAQDNFKRLEEDIDYFMEDLPSYIEPGDGTPDGEALKKVQDSFKKMKSEFKALCDTYQGFLGGGKKAMSQLRKRLIRLAYENPELREHVLPLVTKTSPTWVQ